MTIYTCKKCLKDFDQKSHYDEHNNKKKDCTKKEVLELEKLLLEKNNKEKKIIKNLNDIIKKNNEDEILKEMKKIYNIDRDIFFKYYSYDNIRKIINKNNFLNYNNNNNINTIIYDIQDDKTIINIEKNNVNELGTYTLNTIKKCHNILYSREQIIGQDAHRHILSILFVRLLNKNENFIKGFKSYINNQNSLSRKEKLNNYLSKLINFKLLIKENKDKNNLDIYWNNHILKGLLSFVLEDIFNYNDDRLKCNSTTLQFLLEEIDKLGDLYEKHKDILKQHSYSISTMIFESFVNGYNSDGSQLGQFHTDKKMIICGIKNFVEPYINRCLDKGLFKTEDIKMYDACAGSGGFILENYYNFNLNTNNLYGQEIDKLTIKHLYLNIVLSTGELPKNITNTNSFTNLPETKFHIQGLNPPFGLKGIKYQGKNGEYKGIKEEYNEKNNIYDFKDIYPIQSNKAENLFLQQAINLMEDNGIVQIILPYGELVFSNNKSFIEVRKKLVEERNIKCLIMLPTDLFLSTNIQTFMIIFTKEEKTTEKIDFYNMNNKGELIYDKTVNKIELKKKNYSFKLQDYEKEKLNNEIEYVNLGDICKIDIGGTPSRSNSLYWNGKYKWVSIRDMTNNIQDNIIIDTKEKITNEGIKNSNVKLIKKGSILFSFKLSIGKIAFCNEDIYTNEAIAGFNVSNKNFLNKFIFYYLKFYNDYNKIKSGMIGNGSLNKQKLKNIKIPKYSLEKQKEIIQELEELDNISQNYKNQLKMLKKEKEFFYKYNNNDLNILVKNKDTIKLGDICKINIGGTPSRGNQLYWNGTHKWVSIRDMTNNIQDNIIIDTKEKITDDGIKNSNVKLIKKGSILFSFKLSIGKIVFCNEDIYTNEAIAGFDIIDKNFLKHFIFYYLKLYNDFKSKSGMIGNGSLNKQKIKNIKIPKLSIEEQQEYIKIAKNKDKQINSFDDKKIELEKHIEELKQIGKNILIKI